MARCTNRKYLSIRSDNTIIIEIFDSLGNYIDPKKKSLLIEIEVANAVHHAYQIYKIPDVGDKEGVGEYDRKNCYIGADGRLYVTIPRNTFEKGANMQYRVSMVTVDNTFETGDKETWTETYNSNIDFTV